MITLQDLDTEESHLENTPTKGNNGKKNDTGDYKPRKVNVED